MTEKYIYCPSCRTLTIHRRTIVRMTNGDETAKGWLCESCNPPLEDWS